jgi:sarcosine oxidase subunit gamma
MTTATDFLRRSPLCHELAQSGARFAPLGDAAIAAAFGDTSPAPACAVIDLSPLPRIGFKGWNVWMSLRAAGVPVPGRNNTSLVLPRGGLCGRLSDGEALILPDLDHPSVLPAGVEGLDEADGFYSVARRDTHAWIALAGSEVPEVLAKVCAVDFRVDRFVDLSIAQTMVAGVASIVLRWDRGGAPGFHVLADSMSARYLWQVVLDVAADHGGRPAGFEFLRGLAKSAAEDE